MATLHSPTARWPASSSARVTMPTGLVKSTIQAPGSARRRACSAMSSTRGTVRRALARPPGAGGLLPDAVVVKRPRLVPVARRLAADAQLDQHRGGAVEGVVQVVGPSDGRRMPVPAHDPRRHRADRGQPRLVRVDQDELGHPGGEPAEPVGELRGVGRAATDHRDLHRERLYLRAGLGNMAGNLACPGRCQFRGRGAAFLDGDRAARNRNRQPGVGSIDLRRLALIGARRVTDSGGARVGHGREQQLGVGVARAGQHLLGRAPTRRAGRRTSRSAGRPRSARWRCRG